MRAAATALGSTQTSLDRGIFACSAHSFRLCSGIQGSVRKLSRAAVVLLAGWAVLAPASSAAASDGRSPGLCGLVDPLDDLLHCVEGPPHNSPPPTSSPPPASSPQPNASSPSVSSASTPAPAPVLQTVAPHAVSATPRYVPNLLL